MKKILSVLLAICLMVGMVSVLASAEEATPKKAHYKLPVASSAASGATQTGYDMTEGDADRFYKVNDAGLVVVEGSESDYNIKVTFKQGEPLTLYLKGANITVPSNMGGSANSALNFGKITNVPSTTIKHFDVLIVVEEDSTLKGTWAAYDGSTSGSVHGASTVAASLAPEQNFTITGPGKLTLWSDNASEISVACNLILKDLTLDAKLEITNKWGAWYTIKGANVTFDNTKADLQNNYTGNIEGANITFKNGSNVSVIADSDIESCVNVKATESYTIDNSKLLVQSNGAHAINKSPITMTGVNALGGTKEANAKAFSEKRQADYWYLIAGPDVVIPTEPPTTAPPATTKPAATKATKATTATTAATTAATKPAGNDAAGKPNGGDAANGATTGDSATTPVDNNTTGEKKGGLTWLYILLGVVILAGVAVVVLVIVKRNAAAAEDEEYEEDEEAEEAEEAEAAEEEVTEEPEATEDAE